MGAGYVGLVTGACLADINLDVTCVDIDEDKINLLKKSVVPFYEPALEEIIKRTTEKSKLAFSTDIRKSLQHANVIIIAVGTPSLEDGNADVQNVFAAAQSIGAYINQDCLVVIKSTVPIGTTLLIKNEIQNIIQKRKQHFNVDIASNPEFLKEGNAVSDFTKPDRIIIGVETEHAKNTFLKIYKPFVLNQYPILFMDITSAEMTKYAANAMLATRISFMNEIANLCEAVKANVNMVRMGVGSDNRIGSKFLYSGIGYGGSCFPKDVKAIIKTAEKYGLPFELLKAVESINHQQKQLLFKKLMNHFKSIEGKVFAIWGLAFKAHTDDIREAPSLTLIQAITDAGGYTKVYDPVAMPNAETQLKHNPAVTFCQTANDTIKDANALLIVTEWPEFRILDLQIIKTLLKEHVIFDGRNLLNKDELNQFGFTYYGIVMKNQEALKTEIAKILQSSEMWTYLMDSYHKTKDAEEQELLENDFDNILLKIIELFKIQA
ncbi:hypothetical protein CHS0354_023856 [Potamilus streckersoni]|uniref:UDP-glucose 6-dehydrogenase n=1 Tax=Potamilus streckersoni TaxID=2493646 RepID=A0AAE0VMN1_9BIVA|nr:hypothetical protein CHS0354_023856 [Potamilus streckersoni]